MTPKLSVIIPTRERADTLVHTIRTLVDQDYSDCEIIISDNCSQDNTRQIVESFSDSRLRYINTGKRVSMSDNWEFALRHAGGSFITYIGDDDGFIPGALAGAMAILEKSQMNALVWEKIEYCWPDYIDENMRNWFSLKNRGCTLRIMSGRRKLRQVIRFRDGYAKLPCLYNGIVKKSLVDELKNQSKSKAFFNSISPDVYSGIALGMIVGSYLYTDYPFSVNGASRHSNGTSFSRQRIDGVDNPHIKFIAENQRIYDTRLCMGPSPLICVMGEYLLAKQFLPKLHFQDPSWSIYVNSLIKSARSAFLPSEVLQSANYTIEQLGLKIKVPEQKDIANVVTQPNLGFVGNSFSFIAPHKMVENVYDACQLVAGMLPDVTHIQYRSALNIFAKRVLDCLMIEAKDLYRSL